MRRVLLITLSAVLLAGCRDTAVTRETGSATTIVISKYRFSPQNVSVRHGQVFLAVRNDGPEPSNLEILKNGHEIDRIYTMEPGEVKTLTVQLKPGTYEMISGVGRQEALGQRGRIIVR